MATRKNKHTTYSNQSSNNSTAVKTPEVNNQRETAPSENSIKLKTESLKWILSIVATSVVYFIIAKIIHSAYHPDITHLVEEANKVSFAGDSRPEPIESLLFRVAVITGILGILGFYTLFSKKTDWIKNLAEKPFFLFFSAAAAIFVAGIIYADFAAPNPFASGSGEVPQNGRDLVAKTNFEFFFQGIFLGNNLLLYTFILVPLIACLFYLGIRKYQWDKNKMFNYVVNGIGYVVTGGTILAVVLMNSFEFPYSFENKYNFNAVYYSMTQVYAGVPMLIDGFSNTYGLYPHFLNPLFHITGLSVLTFSTVMGLLIGVSYVFNFYFLKRFVSNNIILFLGICTVIFFPFLDFKFVTPFDCVFSFFSIRYIIPSTLALLTGIYLHKRSRIIYWLTFVLMGFAILWNPEIGMVCYLSWLAVNTYNDFYTAEGKFNIKQISFHWLAGIGIVILTLLIFKVIFYLSYGTSPDYGFLFSFILLFGKYGFGLLPMVLVHPWNITAITILLGIAYSVAHWYKKDITPRASAVFLVTLISIGFFIYFQGRSHNWPFASSTGFSLILLTILGGELWEHVKDSDVMPLHFFFVIFLFLVSFSFFEIITNTQKFNEVVYQEDDKTKQAEENQRIRTNEEFITKHSDEYEKIFVITVKPYQGYYFDGNKRRSAFNPGYQDMVLNTDIKKMETRLIDSSYKVFLDYKFEQTGYMPRLLSAVTAQYEIKESNSMMAMLEKRKNKVPAKTFLQHSNNTVLYKKYSDDIAGIKARVEDAQGIQPLSVNSEFSVEVLFRSQKQIFEYATVLGNMNDSSGFIIGSMVNTKNYFFGINGKGLTLPVPDTGWVYCVMNVYPNHMDVYENGTLAGTWPLAAPIRQSPVKFSVGNLGMFRYYMGAIAEVSVNNAALPREQIEKTSEQIKQAF
jgi:hypothetical protein